MAGDKAGGPISEVLRAEVLSQTKYLKWVVTVKEWEIMERKLWILDPITVNFREQWVQGIDGFVKDCQLNIQP